MESNQTNAKQGSKGILLFLALLLPICIFLFLKFFGRNEFAVEPLFTEGQPSDETCFPVSYPYVVSDSVMKDYPLGNDSLLLLYFTNRSEESIRQRKRTDEAFEGFTILSMDADQSNISNYRKKCIFLMQAPNDLVLIDRNGRIRGHYTSSDREDMDRLITEVTIILKKY